MRHSSNRLGFFFVCLLLAGLLGCDDGDPTPSPAPMDDMSTPGDMQPDMQVDPPDMVIEADMATGTGMLEADETFLDFGTVGLNLRAERDLVLRNTGDGPLTITALEGLEGGFSTSRQPPIRIPAQAERTLALVFSPEAAGRSQITLNLVTEDAGEPLQITLTGVGGEPEGMLVTDVIDFGTVAPGEPTAEFIQVTSTSEIPLTVRGVDGLMPPFLIPDGQLPAVAENGLDAEVLVQFLPEAEGDFEQMITVQTDAGDFSAVVRGRAVAVGSLTVRGVAPAWGPTDAATTITIHGGPFDNAPTRILVGETELIDLERVDSQRVRGTLPAGGEASGTDADQLDVRVEIGGQFGLKPRAFIRTGPVADGSALDAAAIEAGSIDAAGNPWRLAVEVLPADAELTVAPGTVVLCETALSVEGVLRTGGDEGINVFSTPAQAPGGWPGLRFVGASDSGLQDTLVEFAGADGAAAIITQNATTFTRVQVRASAGHGIEVGAGGTLVLLGADLTDLAGDAIRMLEAGGWFRLTNTVIRRAQWPIAAAPIHFGRVPLGLGNDWADNAHPGIGIGGEIQTAVTLGNQPEGIVYALREPLTVRADASLTLASAAPLRLDGQLTVNGRLVLPGGVRIATAAGGALTLGNTATLQATGTPADPVTFEARAPGGDPAPGAWNGIMVNPGATVEATRLIVRDAGGDGPALTLDTNIDGLNGLRIEDSADVALRLVGNAEITTLELSGNARGVLIEAGTGSLAGVTEDGPPAIEFSGQALCGAWDTAGLLDSMGMPASTNCE